jgi:SAM-dependent methyltransferase
VLEELRTVEGEAALAAAGKWVSGDPLVAVTALRGAGFAPELASAAVTQAALRARAVSKFGPDALAMFFTRAGLEQATRAVVARRRAQRLAAAGVHRVADLGCGVGADALAFARAGLRVLAVEADPTTAAMAEANAAVLGLDHLITVRRADASTIDLSEVDAAFCDPARRRVAGGGRVFDPAAYSPPWSFVSALPDRVPATVLKLAPGIDHALLPAGAEAEWVSVGGDVVETAVWAGPLAEVPRRATVIRAERVHQLSGTGERAAPVGSVRSYVYDPDGAVVRSHLVAEFAATVDGVLADSHIAYVFSDRPPDPGGGSPFGRCFVVVEELPFAVKKLRPALRQRGIGRLEILKRGVAVEPDRLRRDLKLDGSTGAALILLRIGDAHRALLCQPESG